MERLADGSIRYSLKTPYKNGTTHVVFEPLDFIARLAALVPKPRFHLTRFHGKTTGEIKNFKQQLRLAIKSSNELTKKLNAQKFYYPDGSMLIIS